MEYDDYIQIWALSADGALSFFGLDAATHHVVVLKDRPETAREIERHLPSARLYGIRAKCKAMA